MSRIIIKTIPKRPVSFIGKQNVEKNDSIKVKVEEKKAEEKKNKKNKKKEDMINEEQISAAEVQASNLTNNVKVVKKDRGLIERTESSKIILTEDNRQVLND